MKYGGILVTGGAGFVGANLAIWFKERFPKISVIAADNLRRPGAELNLERMREHGISFLHCDIRNREDLEAVPAEVDLVLECSAEPSVLAGMCSPEYVIRTNLVGTANCLELARRRRAALVFLSTSRVYPVKAVNAIAFRELETRFSILPGQSVAGVSERGISEEFPLEGARSLYGASKLASELLIEEYGEAYGLPYIIDRCGVLAGPWQMGRVDQGVFSLWMAKHYFGSELTYVGWGGAGKQVRDLLHIEDLADLLAVQLSDLERFGGRVVNVGGGAGCSLSLREATSLCQEIAGRRIAIGSEPENRPADLRLYITDTNRVSGLTGWRPCREPRAILQDIFEWIRGNEAKVRHLWA
jgi:CDP-paratose 2-epimerase